MLFNPPRNLANRWQQFDSGIMRLVLLNAFLLINSCLLGQAIEKILYRGDRVNVYPTDSITMVDVKMIDSLPDGRYCGFFKGDTAFLRLELNYINNVIEGKVIEYYYENRDIEKITNYEHGIKDGYWVEFDSFTGYKEILHEGYYKNGLEQGFQYSYTGEIGSRKVYNKCFYKNDTLIYNIWYGRDSTYYARDTGYVYQYDQQKHLLAFGKEFKHKKIGLWTFYYPNGQIKSIGEYKQIKDQDYVGSNGDPIFEERKNGLWKDFFENGQLSREYICSAQRKGSWISTINAQYDSLGNLLDSASFVNGKGKNIDFYPDGMIQRELYYPDSTFLEYEKYYSPKGLLLYKEEFTIKRTKTRTEYYENGGVKSIERFLLSPDINSVPWDEYLKFGKQEYYNRDGTIKKIEQIKKPQWIE